MYTKDNRIYALYELKMAYPDTCFPNSGPDDQWLAANGFTRYSPPAPAPPTTEELEAQAAAAQAATLKMLTDAVQAHLDAEAHTRNYDGILSACTYATSTNLRFSADGQACVEWRDNCWATCFDVMADVLAGTVVMPVPAMGEPSQADWLIAQLPEMVWPA